MDGLQFHRGDAQGFQVGDGGLGGEPRVGPAQVFGNAGVELGEALDVQFIDQRFVPGVGGLAVGAPVEAFVHHAGEGGEGRAVALVEGQVFLGIAHAVAE
ncbi:MAG: hypothetical protein K0Q91_2384, partial [Fibrobacteria bacterium]|nr:hypothetical protein [Fibrobacteria bacterium]